MLEFINYVFLRYFPLGCSALFAADSINYMFLYQGTDKEMQTEVALVCISASMMCFCLFMAEEMIRRMIISMRETSDTLEEILKQDVTK